MESHITKESYMQKFEIAQRNLELVCEENKETSFCKKQRQWRSRKSQQPSQPFN